MSSLERAFFARPVLEVAPEMLGAVVGHAGVAVRLTEVEAYDGEHDPGSHAYRGETARNAVMFGPPGHLYVYFTYGMHWCVNVVCGEPGRACAVLLRAGEVVAGTEAAQTRRGGAVRERDLARGPARLTQALGLHGAHDGLDLVDGTVTLDLPRWPPSGVRRGPRVGLRHAAERPWRFWIEGDRFVSDYRPATPRRTRRAG